MEPIDLYVGINETKWNYHPVAPGLLSCVAPVYGKTKRTKTENRVVVPDDTVVLQDSGAFSDGPDDRLSFKDAFAREVKHAQKYKYEDKVVTMASYDLLIDEKWRDGQRFKMRWTESEAEQAVDETVEAARYISEHCSRHLVLSAQGVTAQQYLRCTERVAPFFRDGDVLGLGGWCIVGKMPRVMMPVFRETIDTVIPFASKFTTQVHIWGVLYAPALGELLWMCDEYGLRLSTDSSGPQRRPAFGEWGYMGWRDKNYQRPPVETRGLERARHVQATREWLKTFRKTEFYREPQLERSRQLWLI